MTDLAHILVERRQAPDTPARRLLRFVLQPAALGLLLALLAAAAIGNAFYRQATFTLDEGQQSRAAILEGSALAAFVGAHLAAHPDDPATLQAAVAEWVARSPGDDQARVVRIGGAQLLASTYTADLRGELPRRLNKEEKWLFDLGKELRAAADTNRAEGVFRKPQIDVSRPADGRLRITVPYLVDGEIAGFVQHETAVATAADTAPRTPVPAWLLVLAPVAMLLALAYFVNRGGGLQGPSRWILFFVALALFAASWYAYSSRAMAGLEGLAAARNAEVAGTYHELTARIAGLAAEGTPAASPTTLDVDVFQRPRGLLGADGAPDAAAASKALAQFKAPFQRAMWGTLALGAAILAFFALGAGRKVRETIAEYRAAYLYVTPAMIGMLVLVFFPFLYGITLSFTEQTIFNTNLPFSDLWVGVQNYVDILGDFVGGEAHGRGLGDQLPELLLDAVHHDLLDGHQRHDRRRRSAWCSR